jgi:FdhE protein
LHDDVDAALSGVAAAALELPHWDDYKPDYGDGIALLRSGGAAVDLQPAGASALELIERLAAGPPEGALAAMCATLRDELRGHPAPAQTIADWLLGEGAFTPTSPGLLRFLGWTALRRQLQPLLEAFTAWRDEDRWQRPHCPGCGSAPAMAQMVGVEPGHVRSLACGCCGSRWRWRRTACPFCENDPHRSWVVTIESEPGLRIDHCEACRGYLKTYVGQGSEAVMLADWTSLHLDVVARDRGLERRAASLYDLDTLLDG